jgi:NhaA family Na+:H+ antiporter
VLGDRIPNQVRIALLAFAALDDVGGVIVIAATYQSSLSWPLIGLGALLVLAVFGLQRLRVLPALLSILVGLAAFGAVLASGLHPTLAGIALGFAVPTAPLISRGHYLRRSREIAAELTELRNQRIERESRDLEAVELVEQEDELLGRLEALTVGTESSQDRISRSLNPWVSYVVLPLFALANGGVMLNAETFSTALSGPAFWGVVAGLVIGKPLGILGLTWLACRLGIARLPDTMGWGDVAGLGLVAGIGFTVSLFIGELAFGGQPLLPAAKLGILCASLLAGLCGALRLAWVHRRDASH